MSKAMLVCENDKTMENVVLESGSLVYVDLCTKGYSNVDDIKDAYSYKLNDFEEDSSIKVYNVKDRELKEELPLIINDNEPIFIRDPFNEFGKSETEKSRKLLFNSKDRLFLRLFINDERFASTLNFAVALTYNEYTYCKKNDLNVFFSSGKYYIRANDLFKYISKAKKYGTLRRPYEEALEAWRSRILSLEDDEVYYFSRNLRTIKYEYKELFNKKVGIKNLNIITKNVLNVYEDSIDPFSIGEIDDAKVKRMVI